MTRNRCAALAWTLVLAATMRAPTARAETEEHRARRAREILAAVNSPFCPATTIASCGSPQAAAWRHDIQRWVDEGLTKNEICARLEARAGQRLCAGPRTPLEAAVPFLVSLGAVGVLGLVLRRLVRRAPAARRADPATPSGDARAAALDAALDRELAALEDDRP